ncbi:MAG: hypothetical protein AAFZ01_09265 [Pseudomonadota bacterium]
MPLQNRVTPFGDIVATPERGTMMGNRGGCFHRDDGSLKDRRWASKAWIACVLDFKNRRRTLRQPGRYTELFFLDEATALAAGHRPCAECRRTEFMEFAARWNKLRGRDGRAYVREMDDILHAERHTSAPANASQSVTLSGLPEGAMAVADGRPYLKWERAVWAWNFAGYTRIKNPPNTARLITPPAIVEVLADGYRPRIHSSIS